MKNTFTLRLLTLLAFLLLLAPFYDTCNGQRLKPIRATDAVQADSSVVDVDTIKASATAIREVEVDTTTPRSAAQTSFVQKAYEFIDDDDSENAFEFAKTSLDEIFAFDSDAIKGKIKESGNEGIFFLLKNFCFIFIVLITSASLVLSFLKKRKWINNLSLVNLILLTVTLACIFLEGTFENFAQIKWGYYVFIAVNFMIFHYSKSALKTQKS